jgi:hypothetical protein
MFGKVGLHILFLARQNINHKKGGWSAKRIFAAASNKGPRATCNGIGCRDFRQRFLSKSRRRFESLHGRRTEKIGLRPPLERGYI